MPNPQDPDPRVVLALERTTLVWTRTALALMGFGFVVSRLGVFLRELHPTISASGRGQWIGLAIVALGGAVQIAALVTHVQSVRRLRASGDLPLRTMSPAMVRQRNSCGSGVSRRSVSRNAIAVPDH